MRLLLCWLCLSFGCLTSAKTLQFSSGNKKVHLLELYSSQGCSSCPPAQNWVNELQDSPALWDQVIPVVFHVDYWDYLGWKDPFSKSQFSFRQRAHKREGNVRSVYTPGFVVNGNEWKGWFRGRDLDLTASDAGELKVAIKSNPLGVIHFDASFAPSVSQSNSPLKLNLALLVMNNKTQVLAGENRAKQLNESFIVLDLLTLDEQGSAPFGGKRNYVRFSDIVTVSSQVGGFAAWISKKDSLQPIQSTGGYF